MGKEFNDIESYRRMRKKKLRKRRFITVFTVIVLIACLLFTFYHHLSIPIFGNSESYGELTSGEKPEKEGFPISLEGEKAVDINSMGGLITLITDIKLAMYSDAGKWIGSDTHGFANPVTKTTEKRILIYDRGGYKFKVLSKNDILGEKTLTEKIIFAEISESGYIAVATQTSHYYGCLTVYDNKLSEIYKWYSSESQLIAMDFYKGSRGCAVLGYAAQDGGIVSTLTSLEFSKEQVVFEKKFPDMLGVSVAVKNSGNIAIVGDSQMVMLDENGESIGEYVYNKQLSYASNDSGNYTVLALSNPNSRDNSQAVVLDDKAQVVGKYTVEKKIKDVVSDGSRVLLLGYDKIYNLDMSLKLINTIKCDADAKKIAYVGSYVYILSSDNIVKNIVN